MGSKGTRDKDTCGMMKMETRFGAEFVDPKGHDQPTDLDGVDGDARSCEYY
jgi:hypothetical protein